MSAQIAAIIRQVRFRHCCGLGSCSREVSGADHRKRDLPAAAGRALCVHLVQAICFSLTPPGVCRHI